MDIPINPLNSFSGGENAALRLAAARRRDAKAESSGAVLENARENGGDPALRRACGDFESYFLQIVFREMRKTSFAGENGISRNDRSGEIFRDMLDEEYAKSAAESGGIGLAETLYKAMSGRTKAAAVVK